MNMCYITFNAFPFQNPKDSRNIKQDYKYFLNVISLSKYSNIGNRLCGGE